MNKQTELMILCREALEALCMLKYGDCWCEFGMGNPMYKDHTNACKETQKVYNNLSKTVELSDCNDWGMFEDNK